MTFSMIANVSIPLNKGDLYETRLPTDWLWSACSSNLQSEL